MPGIIALAVITIVVLTVLSFTVHFLFSPWLLAASCRWTGCGAGPGAVLDLVQAALVPGGVVVIVQGRRSSSMRPRPLVLRAPAPARGRPGLAAPAPSALARIRSAGPDQRRRHDIAAGDPAWVRYAPPSRLAAVHGRPRSSQTARPEQACCRKEVGRAAERLEPEATSGPGWYLWIYSGLSSCPAGGTCRSKAAGRGHPASGIIPLITGW